MSDRYETPRWGDEPKEFESADILEGEDQDVEAEESDLDAASENVLDGWPAVEPDVVEADDALDVADLDEADERGRQRRTTAP